MRNELIEKNKLIKEAAGVFKNIELKIKPEFIR